MSEYSDRLNEYLQRLQLSTSGYRPAVRRQPQVPQQPGLGNQLINTGGKLVAREVLGGGGGEGLASSAAENAAWNSAADAATGLPTSMGPTPLYVPAAVAVSTALAGKAGLDMLKGKEPKGPSGLFGRAQLAVSTGGLSEVGKLLGFGRGYSNLEEKLREKLAEKGIKLSGENAWEQNEAFAKSRNEADLLGKDITGAATFYQIPDWQRAGNDIREKIAQEALTRNLVREHNGGMEVTANDDFLNYASGLIGSAPPPKQSIFDNYADRLNEYLAKLGAANA